MNDEQLMAFFTKVANETMGIETLVTRNSDSLDFHDVSVGSLRAAFNYIYQTGLVAGQHTLTKQK